MEEEEEEEEGKAWSGAREREGETNLRVLTNEGGLQIVPISFGLITSDLKSCISSDMLCYFIHPAHYNHFNALHEERKGKKKRERERETSTVIYMQSDPLGPQLQRFVITARKNIKRE